MAVRKVNVALRQGDLCATPLVLAGPKAKHAPMAQRNNLARTCTSLLGAAFVTAGLAGFTVGGAVTAGATVTPDGSPVCGPAMTITGLDTASSPLGLTVPQYNGSATVTSAVLSIQVTESFQGSFLNGSGEPYPGTGSNDFVGVSSVLEATGPGLSTLSPVAVGATFAGIGFNSFTAGNPLPTFPSGVAGAEAQNADGVGTGTAIPNTWTGLGFPFTPSPSPATAKGTATFTTSDASIPASNFGAYTGTGNVNIAGRLQHRFGFKRQRRVQRGVSAHVAGGLRDLWGARRRFA